MAAVGIVANPASGRDVRRLVAQASVFPTAEKANMVQRMLGALASVDVDDVLLSVDLGGISAAVLRASTTRRSSDPPWPRLRFCDEDGITGTATDTRHAVRRMVDAGVNVVICLGGDGTSRVAATALRTADRTVPLLSLSTGTNNAFPELREATVAGVAAGLLATGQVDTGLTTWPTPMLEVTSGDRTEMALVDVAVSKTPFVGAKALWHPSALTELYCAFAEPDAIGLSAVAGQLCPSPRHKPDGVVVRLCPLPEAHTVVRAPIAPGLVLDVGVRDWRPLRSGEQLQLTTAGGVVAVDGERELELHRSRMATVRLRDDGPRRVDTAAVLREAAAHGLLRTDLSPVHRWRDKRGRGDRGVTDQRTPEGP